jgi:hypothetical protein
METYFYQEDSNHMYNLKDFIVLDNNQILILYTNKEKD